MNAAWEGRLKVRCAGFLAFSANLFTLARRQALNHFLCRTIKFLNIIHRLAGEVLCYSTEYDSLGFGVENIHHQGSWLVVVLSRIGQSRRANVVPAIAEPVLIKRPEGLLARARAMENHQRVA